ncbi:hypothetical protein [Bacillus sp. SA1-12]|nr:hypothetical protein [Bacillus sp. SA1-12]
MYQVEIVYNQKDANMFLSENANLDIKDIKLSSLNTADSTNEVIMIIYKK